METYSVRVTKDYMLFCSAHFISYENDRCERVHGHNYRVAAEITGTLDDNHLVIDFIALKGLLREIVNELDHRVLLPRDNPVLKVCEEGDEVIVNYVGKKRWVFPAEDSVILPIANTTAELMAKWIAGRLGDELAQRGFAPFAKMVIEVEESAGQLARYELVP